jgi:c-di-GMP-binding flagellar brake protein YcgR
MVRERRAATRVKVDISASMDLFHYDMHLAGVVHDLSLGGCFIRLEGELPVGERCSLQLTLGEGLETRSIAAQGRIVRTSQYGLGIQFIEMSASDHDLLLDFIRTSASR